jgi:hypothetical protein
MPRIRRPYTGPERADDVLQRFLRKHEVLVHASDSRVASVWAEVVGPAAASDSMVASCEHGLLTVVTADPGVSHLLQSRTRDLVRRLNQMMGRETVRRIRFQVGNVSPRPVSQNGAAARAREGAVTPDDMASVTLGEAEVTEIEALAAAVPEGDARERTRRALERHCRADKVLVSRGWKPCVGCAVLLPPSEPDDRCPVCGGIAARG